MRKIDAAVFEPPDHAESIQSGHLNIEKCKGGIELLNQVKRFNAIACRPDHFNVPDTIQKKQEFVTGESLVVGDDRAYGNGRAGLHELLLYRIGLIPIVSCLSL